MGALRYTEMRRVSLPKYSNCIGTWPEWWKNRSRCSRRTRRVPSRRQNSRLRYLLGLIGRRLCWMRRVLTWSLLSDSWRMGKRKMLRRIKYRLWSWHHWNQIWDRRLALPSKVLTLHKQRIQKSNSIAFCRTKLILLKWRWLLADRSKRKRKSLDQPHPPCKT